MLRVGECADGEQNELDPLIHEPGVNVIPLRDSASLTNFQAIILPGSKQTVDDLLWLRSEGLDHRLLDHACTSLIVRICGDAAFCGITTPYTF